MRRSGRTEAMNVARGPERRKQLRISRWRPGSATRRSACCTSACCARISSKIWVERCEAQIGGVLEVLEQERAAVKTPYWFGERIGHADIAVACVLRFTGEAHPALFAGGALSGTDGACRALRGAAGVPGNRAAAGAAEGGLRSSQRPSPRRIAAHSAVIASEAKQSIYRLAATWIASSLRSSQ